MASEISAEKDIIACFKCGTQTGGSLCQLVHPKVNLIVGCIFVCEECLPELCGKGLAVILAGQSKLEEIGEDVIEDYCHLFSKEIIADE